MKGLFERFALSGVLGCACALSSAIAACALICSSLPDQGMPFALARVALVAACLLACLAVGTRMALGLRQCAPSGGRRLALAPAQAARGLALRSLLAAACALGLCAVAGAFAVIAPCTVLPAFGLGAAVTAIRIFALAAALAAAPVPVMLAVGFALSRRGAWRPGREVASMGRAYLPLLAATALGLLAGWAIRALCGLVPVALASDALFALGAAALGALWLVAACALCLCPEGARRAAAQAASRLPLPSRPAHRAR